MRIKCFTLRNYYQFRSVTLALPERGLVVVQGRNGEGKSAIVDAPAVAGWGTTLRGREWWKQGQDAEVTIETYDDLTFGRTRAAKGKQLNHWTYRGVSTRPDTVTKGQTDLNRLIGEFMPWRSSHVFSSRDAAKFAGITDASRKRLLEAFLGNTALDGASKLVKADLRNVTAKVQEHSSKLEVLAERLAALQRELATAEDFISSLPVPLTAVDDARIISLTSEISEAADAMTTAQRGIAEAQAVISAPETWHTAQAKAAEAAREYQRATAGCEKCRKPISCGCTRDPSAAQVTRDSTAEEAARVKAADQAARADARTKLVVWRNALTAATVRHTECTQDLEDLMQRAQSAEAHAPRKAELALRTKELRLDISLAQEEYDDLLTICAAAEREAALLTLVDRTLGLSGIRTVLLGRTLDNIAKLANLALTTLSNGTARLALLPYAEAKNGTISDAIALKVYGWADDRGYEQLSDGQQRVIDLALLIGTGLVAEAAQGRTNGTMFFDEAFDALDDEVAPRAGALISELAETRCCVVISHSEKVIGSMRPQMILHVEAGRILEL